MWRAFERAGYATTNKIRPAPVRKSRHHPKRKRAKPKRPARRQL
jgi:hypothetical protein